MIRSAAMLAIVCTLGAEASGAAMSLESATMGPAPQAVGQQLSATQYIGWRFMVNKPLAVTHVGGHLGGRDGKLFAAIVALTTIDALPTGAPFGESDVQASVAFTPPEATADVRVPLPKMLTPGPYALVFGSGQFEATGVGMMATAQQTNVAPTQQSSYITWRQTLPGQYHWTVGSVNHARLVLVGAEVSAAGDFNLNGHVDGSDLLVWKGNFGVAATGEFFSGDSDTDRDVDGADFLTWQRTYTGGSGAAAAPEPSTATMGLAAAVLLACGARRRVVAGQRRAAATSMAASAAVVARM